MPGLARFTRTVEDALAQQLRFEPTFLGRLATSSARGPAKFP
jgi:hypothetical protein